MMSGLLSLVLGAVAGLLRDALADYRRDKALEAKGAAEAALKTSQQIQERADDQRENDMADRGDAADVADRLRRRIQSGRG